ncbi:hypothetical protein HYQ46_003418 [Verticillium longisporum]|nr:hypothetical protein HYQ46_003418 [Verticillium longisporum]
MEVGKVLRLSLESVRQRAVHIDALLAKDLNGSIAGCIGISTSGRSEGNGKPLERLRIRGLADADAEIAAAKLTEVKTKLLTLLDDVLSELVASLENDPPERRVRGRRPGWQSA